MRVDRTVVVTALAAIGAALLVFPFLPGRWPNPVPEGAILQDEDLFQLKMAAQRVDLACGRGDLARFGEAVTPEHLQRLQRQLDAIRKPLDAAALKQFHTDRDYSFAELLRMPILACEVKGDRAVVAVDHPAEDGARVLEFVWDGRKMRLDDSRLALEARGPSRARTAVVEAAMRKRK